MRNFLYLGWAALIAVALPAMTARSQSGDFSPTEHFARIPGQPLFSVVQTKGEFGKELNLEAFEHAVRSAVDEHVDYIVIVLDSDGGPVADAELIADELIRVPSTISVVTYVKKALSASVWVLAASDTVLFSTRSASGAAVAFYEGRTTGELLFDRKENSAIAGRVAGLAESNGQPGEVYRAMIDPGSSLWTVPGADGTTVYQQNEPAASAHSKLWDSDTTVLTVTAAEAEELGLGLRCLGTDAEIARALGITNAKFIREPGIAFSRSSKDVTADIYKQERLQRSISKFQSKLQSEFTRFTQAELDAKQAKPYWFYSDQKYSGYNRRSYLDRIDRYRKSLLELQTIIKSSAEGRSDLGDQVRSHNYLANKINERLGHTKYETLDHSFDEESKSAMERAWTMTEEELRWCTEQE